jgi:hypothetical protein
MLTTNETLAKLDRIEAANRKVLNSKFSNSLTPLLVERLAVVDLLREILRSHVPLPGVPLCGICAAQSPCADVRGALKLATAMVEPGS